MRLFRARVSHRRLFPVRYRFSYRVFDLLVDVDRVAADARRMRLFSYNRFNLLSFHDRDHGPRDGSSLREWAERVLREAAGIDLAGGRVRLLCLPRVLGYAFNPISLWFCEHRDGGLRAVLCEVHSTFGERHTYVLHEAGRTMRWPVHGTKCKRLHVSPLMDMEGEYRFRIAEPGERAAFTIVRVRGGRRELVAAWSGEARECTDAALLACALSMPLMTVKVIAMIHWQALLIWLRGAPFSPRPTPSTHEFS